MPEYLTAEELRQRSGEAFFEGDRLERLCALVGSVMSVEGDEVWVSAHDNPPEAVRGGKVMGMRVVVTAAVPAGGVWLWSACRKQLLGPQLPPDLPTVRELLYRAARAREGWLVEFLAREDRIVRGGRPWRI